jgi:hypothetical protein
MESATELGLMQDEQLDAVAGGCGGYKYRPSREEHESRRGGSRRGNVVAVSDINNISLDDINITADDGSQVFVTFVQEN